MKHIASLMLMLAASSASMFAAESTLLTGTAVGCTSVDYSNGQPSTTVNTPQMAFDGDFNTCYASYDRSFTWVGLQLDQPYVITRVGWAARNDGHGPGRMQLGIFQGANNADFSDAMPIYLIDAPGKIGEMMYADIDCTKGFKYVRYVGPHDSRCNVGELEFYGYASAGSDERYYHPTNLPLVVVNTPDMEWFHEDDKSYEMNGSTITIVKPDGTLDLSKPGQIRGRGNASWGFPKKPFRIKFDKKQKVLGGPANAKKWTMISNYSDKTLMRNKLAYDISAKLGMDFTPVCNFVDCIFNGEYLGTYQLCDQVEVKEHRVDITEMEPTDTEGDALTGGYLIEIDAYADQEPADEWFQSQGGHYIPVTIKSPDPGVSQQYNYIRSRFSTLERSVFSANYADPTTGYRQYLDLDTWIRHFLINELAGNTDTYWSTYLSKERGDQRFRVAAVWDFDIAFDNDSRTYPINTNVNGFLTYSGRTSFANGMEAFSRRINIDDAAARNRRSVIWSLARKTQDLTTQWLTALVDTYAAQLQQSQRLNFMRWPILNTAVHQNPSWAIPGSYEGECNVVKKYITARFPLLDNAIGLVDVSGIDDINADNNAEPRYYNLQGQPVAHPVCGVYIVVRGNTVTKEAVGNK